MSILDSIFKPAPPPPVPVLLPAISLPTAAAVAVTAEPAEAARQLLTPQQTPSEYLAALQEKKMGADMIKTLAHGLPDREGVMWAAKSAEKVADKLPPAEVEAMQAALAWARNPTEATQAAAAAAAAKTELQGPGAWAAQAAAWSNPPMPEMPRLTPPAVSAAVLMAAAIQAFPKEAAPKGKLPDLKLPDVPTAELAAALADAPPPGPAPVVPPKVLAKTFESQHPFITMGLDIASGKTPTG